jgi:hypothetical protein
MYGFSPGIAAIVVAIACFVVSISATDYFRNRIVQNVVAANGQLTTTPSPLLSLNGGNIALGSPQFNYTELDKISRIEPAIVNGTHGILGSFTGQGILNGINVTAFGKAFITNSTGGTTHSTGYVKLVSGVGTAAFTYQRIGHRGGNGVGVIFSTNATGNLAFVGNAIGIFGDADCGPGCSITKTWIWK